MDRNHAFQVGYFSLYSLSRIYIFQIAMRQQDKALMRQLLELRAQINQLRGTAALSRWFALSEFKKKIFLYNIQYFEGKKYYECKKKSTRNHSIPCQFLSHAFSLNR